jgi:hypothetical protein
MNIDTEKIDEVVLALLYLPLHDGRRAWKSLDRDAINACARLPSAGGRSEIGLIRR